MALEINNINGLDSYGSFLQIQMAIGGKLS